MRSVGMNVFRQEFRMAQYTMLGWMAALILVTLLFISIFPAFSHDIQASKSLLTNIPASLRSMFGLSLDTFGSFLGFYTYTFVYVGLAGAVQAMNLGLLMLSREPNSKTTDFLLSRPITRTKIVVSKLFSALTVLVLTNIVLNLATILFAVWFGVGNFSGTVFLLLSAAFFLVQLMFLGIGMLVSQFFGRIKSIMSVSLAVVFCLFAIALLQGLTGDDIMRYLTPFKYFDHLAIVANRAIELPFLWLSLVVIVTTVGVGSMLYCQRDARSGA